MVHTSMSALGWVVGGEDTVVLSLLDVLGPRGTLAAYAGWDENPYHLAAWPEHWRRAYEAELPAYDPGISVADHDVGRIPERIRTWPGATRGEHPEANLVALGPRAAWLVCPHPFDEAYGEGTPLARLVEADGQVLMLGAPLGTLTLLHHAEAIADVPKKRRVSYRIPVLRNGERVWVDVHDIDTSSTGAFPYERVVPAGGDSFEVIAREALGRRVGATGNVGESTSHVFDAPGLVRFAVRWIEDRFKG
jgi:aminoglycoside 3-N-acetyltransferase